MRRDWGLLVTGAFGAAVTVCSGSAGAFFPPVPVDPPVNVVDKPTPPPPPVIVPPVVPPVSPPPFSPPPPVSPPPIVPPVVPPTSPPPTDCPTPQPPVIVGPQVVPEPLTVVSAGIGLAAVLGWNRRKKR